MRVSSSRLSSSALLLSVTLASSACRGSVGEPCRQAEDCRDGLVCVVNGVVLAPGDPPTAQAGECSEDDMLADSETSVGMPPSYDDLPSKRDLGAEDEGGDGDAGDGDAGDGDAGDGDGTGGDGDGTGGDGDGSTDTTSDTGGGDGDGDSG